MRTTSSRRQWKKTKTIIIMELFIENLRQPVYSSLSPKKSNLFVVPSMHRLPSPFSSFALLLYVVTLPCAHVERACFVCLFFCVFGWLMQLLLSSGMQSLPPLQCERNQTASEQTNQGEWHRKILSSMEIIRCETIVRRNVFPIH